MNRLCLALLGGALCLSTAHTVTAQSYAETAEGLMSAYHEAGLFNGTVLVAHRDSVLHASGYGLADMEWEASNQVDTIFRIASVTKQFTAAMVYLLEEDGLIDVDEPIGTYLAEYPRPQGDVITVHHLLTNRAGVPNYTSLPGWEDVMRDPAIPDSFMTTFAGLNLKFRPGTSFDYSNSNYYILGVLIERVTGQSYADVMQARIFDPLGMEDTGADVGGVVLKRRARGYERTPAGFVPEAYIDMSRPFAAGMLYSTVTDLHRWKRALHGGEVFSNPETLRRMLTSPDEGGFGYASGIGYSRKSYGGDTLLVAGHGGRIEGFGSDDVYYPEEEWTVIVLDNTNSDVGRVSNDLVRLLQGIEVELPRKPIAAYLAEVLARDGVEEAVARYQQAKQNEPENYAFDSDQLLDLGYQYLVAGDTGTALPLLLLCVEEYPESPMAHLLLGEAYRISGDADQARAHYRHTLELDPENVNAKTALQLVGAQVQDQDAVDRR
ncbi:MAG: serine hydrolase [Bacteroidota bacterium]